MRRKNNFLLPAVIGFALCGAVHALTSGPSMPEYSSFEPVDAPDMVQMSSGSFQYSIPILSVPGPGLSYPIALSYHAGIPSGAEASWVGLGWNFQPGAITRQINKLPDDYRRAAVYDFLKSKNIIIGDAADASVFGITFGLSHDTYNGYGGLLGAKVPNTNVALSYGWNGVYDGIGISYSKGMFGGGLHYSKGTVTVSGQFNLTATDDAGESKAIMSLASVGVSLSSEGVTGVSTSGFLGSQEQHAAEEVKTDARNTKYSLFVAELNDRHWNSWIEGYNFNNYYGFLYGDVDGMDCRNQPANCSNHSPNLSTGWTMKVHEYQESTEGIYDHARLHTTTQDYYMVAGQGIGGTFKPYRREDGDYLNVLKNTSKYEWDWSGGDRVVINRTKTIETGRNSLYKDNASKGDIYWRFLGDESVANRSEIAPAGRDIGEAYAASSKKIVPVFDLDPITGQPTTISGFKITKEDGAIYEFKKPLYVLSERTSTVFKDDVLDHEVDFEGAQTKIGKYAYVWLLTAIKAPDFVNLGSDQDNFNTAMGGWVKFNYQMLAEPYNWVSPYVDKTVHTDLQANRDFGPGPYTQTKTIDGVGYATGRVKSEGRKEIAYLKSIETPSHIAEFQTSDRLDALPATKPTVHRFERAPCSGECVRPATYVYRNQFLLPKSWTGLRAGDRIVRRQFTTLSAGWSYDNTSARTLTVQQCDKSTWDPSMVTSDGVSIMNYAENCVVDPDLDWHPPTPRYVMTFSFTYANDVAVKLKQLDKIVLKSKFEMLNENDVGSQKPVSHVNFRYSYALCPNTPNSGAANKGKLTLESVRSGADESGAEMPPFVFRYYNSGRSYQSGAAVAYEKFETDRWGYLNQSATDASHWSHDDDVKSWSLNEIALPSGGKIQVEYESNRISYVGKDEYFRDVSGGYWAANWHQDEQYSPSKTVSANPLQGLNAVPLKGIEVTFSEVQSGSVWFNLQPQIKYMSGTTVQTLTMPKTTAPASSTLRWVLPATPVINTSSVIGFTVLGAPTKYWMQASMLISPLADRSIAGGGLRAKSVSIVDPVTQKTRKVDYTYFNGAVDGMPSAFSDYNDTHVKLGWGRELYEGTSSSVFYEKVRAKFAGTMGYTDYQFFTPREIGTSIIPMTTNLGNDASGHTLYRLEVNDLTSFWGMLIKKQDFKEGQPNVPVREEGSKWVMPPGAGITGTWIQEEFPKVAGKTDLFNTLGLDVDSPNAHFGFGVHRTVSSARYFYLGCYVSSGCQSDPPIATTQVVKNTFTPHVFETYSIQDGVKSTVQHYNWDALTGLALMTKRTMYEDFIYTHIITKTVPAYSIYPELAAKNQLTQPYSNTTYYYRNWNGNPSPPTYQDSKGVKLPTSGDAASEAVSGSVTRWRPFTPTGVYHADAGTSSTPFVWRKFEDLSFRDRATFDEERAFFAPLSDACTPSGNTYNCTDGATANWLSSGKVKRYDLYGHELEFLQPTGTSASQTLGYRNSLVTSFAQNSKSRGLFYESFEMELDAINKMTQGVNQFYHIDRSRSKTGAASLEVYNEGAGTINRTCFALGDLEAGTPYTASVWFYDKQNPGALPLKPGISFGGTGACFSETYPSGLAVKSGKWVRVEVNLSAAQCSEANQGKNASLCLFASKGEAGPGVRYDELRVSPAAAFMTTFTYDAKGRMTSSADPGEIVTSFEYDNIGDLIGTRNDDGVLKNTQAKQLGRN